MSLEQSEPVVRLRSTGPSPELVGGGAAALLIAAGGLWLLLGGLLGGPGDGPEPSRTPGPTATPVVTPPPIVDLGVTQFLIVTNQRLLELGEGLTQELARDPLQTPDVRALIVDVNGSARTGAEGLPNLGPTTQEGRDLQDGLRTLYGDLQERAGATLRASVTNDAAHRSGAADLVAMLERLPALQARLEAIRDAPPPTAAPSAAPTSPAPTATPAASATASATPEPTPSPSAEASPSGSPDASVAPSLGPNQVVDGGFEAGVGAPWRLDVSPAASARLDAETTDPAAGAGAARVTIVEPTRAFSGVILRQAGMAVDAGARYTIRVALRSATSREIRVALASAAGDTYVTRSVTATPVWTVVTVTFTAPVSDGGAVLAFELGREGATTWLDEVYLGPPIAGQP